MTKGVWRLVGIFLLSTYFTLLYHLMSTISSGIYYIEHFVLDSMDVYNDLVLNFCFCWFCLVCPNCYSVLALDFFLFLLIVIHSMLLPDFICIYPNCYSVLIIDLVLSIRMLFCASHYICLLCPNYCPCLSLT